MNRQEWRENLAKETAERREGKANFLMEVRKAGALQQARLTELHRRQHIRYIDRRIGLQMEQGDKEIWLKVKAFNKLRDKRDREEAKRKAEIIRRRRDRREANKKAKQRELSRYRLALREMASARYMAKQVLATERLLAYCPEHLFDLVGKTVRFSQRGAKNYGLLEGKVDRLRQKKGIIFAVVKVPYGVKKQYLVSIKNLIV